MAPLFSLASVSESASLQQKRQETPYVDGLEAATWLFVTSIYFTWYNPVGELARARDTSNSLLQRLDDQLSWTSDLVPYVPAMVVPYVLVYAMPLFYLLSMVRSRGLDIARVRAFFLTQMAMITTAFVLYYAFPCKTDLLWNEQKGRYENYGEDSWLGRLCFKFVHQGISLYVAFPSMHTAHAFSTAMAFAHDHLPATNAMWALAAITLLSTTMTKAHHPPHLAAGLLVAFAVQTMVFQPLMARLSCLRRAPCDRVRLYAIALVPVVFIAVGEKLHEVSGWNTDIPAMFGFESNPVHGLYGFKSR